MDRSNESLPYAPARDNIRNRPAGAASLNQPQNPYGRPQAPRYEAGPDRQATGPLYPVQGGMPTSAQQWPLSDPHAGRGASVGGNVPLMNGAQRPARTPAPTMPPQAQTQNAAPLQGSSQRADLSSRTAPLPNLANSTEDPQDRDSNYYLYRLEEIIRNARKMPFSEQVMLDRMDLLILIDNIRKSLPDDIRRAQWLLDQNHKLITETRKEAEKIMRDAEQEIAKMVDEHEITEAARGEARRIMDEANDQSKQAHEEAHSFVDQQLAGLEDELTEMLVYVRKNRSELA